MRVGTGTQRVDVEAMPANHMRPAPRVGLIYRFGDNVGVFDFTPTLARQLADVLKTAADQAEANG